MFRIANAPDRGWIHDVLWRRVLPPFVTRFVPNSRFSYARLQETGVPEAKITLIRNAISQRAVPPRTDEEVVQLASARPTILTVGQIAPFKGTHLTVEATLALIAEGRDLQTLVVGMLPVVAAGARGVRGMSSRADRRGGCVRSCAVRWRRGRTCWIS